MAARGSPGSSREAPVTTVTVEARTRLREKRQVTLPEAVATASHAAVGDEFVATFDPASPDIIVLRRVRDTYFGILRDGEPAAERFVEAERAAWGAGR
jgi:hypothetical protein